MSFAYTPFKAELLRADFDFETGDFRILLVMSNTTADTEQDAEFIATFATLDEYDGANYVRKTLAGEAVTQDDANNRGEFTANAFTWTALGVGTRQAVGAVLYRFVTNDADSPVVAYINTGGFPFDGNGGDVIFTPDAQGLLQTT